MPIQRLYNLPSCTLQIEGISAEGGTDISILTGFEYRFHNHGNKVSGGREFLDRLTKSIIGYVQSLQAANPNLVENEFISIEPRNFHTHILKVKAHDTSEFLELQLTTVELFDLAESIDRLCLDPQTLPDLNPQIAPINSARKSGKSVSSLLPAFIGVGTLAIASTLIFLIPPPKPEPKPQPVSMSLTVKPSSSDIAY
jgi:hypothetical protein